MPIKRCIPRLWLLSSDVVPRVTKWPAATAWEISLSKLALFETKAGDRGGRGTDRPRGYKSLIGPSRELWRYFQLDPSPAYYSRNWESIKISRTARVYLPESGRKRHSESKRRRGQVRKNNENIIVAAIWTIVAIWERFCHLRMSHKTFLRACII